MKYTKYAMVRNDKIIKQRDAVENDMVILPKLLAHGYLPIVEQALPFFAPVTQTAADSYEIQFDRVLHKWAVSEQPFIDAQQNKAFVIEQQALDEIKSVFGDTEQVTKVTEILTAKDTAVDKVKKAKTNAELWEISLDKTKKK